MKRFVLILAGCLALVGFGAHADDIGDAARAAVRRGTSTATAPTRQKTDPVTNEATTRTSSGKAANIINRGTTQGRSATIINRSSEQTAGAPLTVVSRTGTALSVAPRTRNDTTSSPARIGDVTTARSATRTTTPRTLSRATTTVATREDVFKRNYSQCKTVFNECMDEFCANKDSQLKRCACSSRVNEFNKIKQQLENIDEKMLDFNQRLLTVNMDKEDAAALNIATEGEKAFYDTRDVSESKRTLNAIADKLNASFDNNTFSSGIGNVLSWSLDIDSAFDTVDSLGGISTTAKSGTALYSAALPICREMAAEVCSDDDLVIAENGYMVMIGQDCNTVEKTYKTAIEQARSKVLESSALLDISRLDIYQKRNSDDILTCKRKMLTMLTDSTVCGDGLGKCLDITGQYIDPSTGEVFLSSNLSNLGNLITRPSGDETWTGLPDNSAFVYFLNSKKKFLEPATENCQNIADTVWDAFVEDALSQIKIAQLRKLEDVRQGCTTLVSQCLTDATDSITNFDSRALSIFGVTADTTANAMCDSVLSSCTTLLNTTDTDAEWYAGITGIQTDITYDTIMKTCREVGRACIIQVCASTSGNFGLCENIDTSINRKSIVNRTACWDQVLDCVKSAGESAISEIFGRNELNVDNEYILYSQIYKENIDKNPTITNAENNSNLCVVNNPYNSDNNSPCIYDICYEACGHAAYTNTDDCRSCRLAESIWGNCEAEPATLLTQTNMHNEIKKPKDDTSTLLYWFAQNTGTDGAADNCRDTTCGVGFTAKYDSTTGAIMCIDTGNICDDGGICTTNKTQITSGMCNCCAGGPDSHGNCCTSQKTITVDGKAICVPNSSTMLVATFTIADGESTYYPAGNYALLCTGTITNNSNPVNCTGRYIIVRSDASRYMDPLYNTAGTQYYVHETFKSDANTQHTHEYTGNSWTWNPQFDGDPNRWSISFGQ